MKNRPSFLLSGKRCLNAGLLTLAVGAASAQAAVPTNITYMGMNFSDELDPSFASETTCSAGAALTFDGSGDVQLAITSIDYSGYDLDADYVPDVFAESGTLSCFQRSVGPNGYYPLFDDAWDLDGDPSVNVIEGTYDTVVEAGLGLYETNVTIPGIPYPIRKTISITPDLGLLMFNDVDVSDDYYGQQLMLAVNADSTLVAADLEGASFSGMTSLVDYADNGYGKEFQKARANFQDQLIFSAGGFCQINSISKESILRDTVTDSDFDPGVGGNDNLVDYSDASTIYWGGSSFVGWASWENCTYTVDGNGLVEVRAEDTVNAPGVSQRWSEFYLDQSGEYMVQTQSGGAHDASGALIGATPELPIGTEWTPKGFGLFFRDETRVGDQQALNDSVAGTFLIQSSLEEYIQGQEFLISSSPAILTLSIDADLVDANWNTCSYKDSERAAWNHVTGVGASSSVVMTTGVEADGVVNSAWSCRFQVASSGALTLELGWDDDGDQIAADFIDVVSGFVASTNQALVLTESAGEGLVDLTDFGLAGLYLADEAWTYAAVGIKYTGDLSADADSDNNTNEEEFFDFNKGVPVVDTSFMVGSWTLGDPSNADGALITFNADGTYAHAESLSGSPDGGAEGGDYSIDYVLGTLNLAVNYDTGTDNGLDGIPVGEVTPSVDGDTLTLEFASDPNNPAVLTRLPVSADILGTWEACFDGYFDFTFFANGRYIHRENGGAPSITGSEYGAYTWDNVTGDLVFTAVDIDGNGFTGASGIVGDINTLIIGDMLYTTLVDEGETIALSRVGGSASCYDDADSDGMNDFFEVIHGFDINNPADANLDADGDVLTNVDEFYFGSNPHLADTDSDGIADLDEMFYGFDPAYPDGLEDYDFDTFTNAEEIEAGSDPFDGESIPLSRAAKNDFNGDGVADILWRKIADGQVKLIVNDNAGLQSFGVNKVLRDADWAAQQGDFNGDGRMDILWRNTASALVEIELSSADGDVLELIYRNSRGLSWAADVADFNGDNVDDILWRNLEAGKVQIDIGDIYGAVVRTETLFNKYAAWVHQLADFDDDGRTDILWRKPSAGTVKVALSDINGNQGIVTNHFSKWDAWSSTLGDFNGDGRADILWRKTSAGTVKIALSGPVGEQASIANHYAKYGAWSHTVGDFNGDGNDDILWRKLSQGIVKIALSDVNGLQGSIANHYSKWDVWQHFIGDYNGDGRDDILWRKPSQGDVKIAVSDINGLQGAVANHFDKSSSWDLLQ